VHATVTCVDDAPHAVDDARTVAEDSGANAVDVLGNDTDLDGGPITITDVTQPDNGAVAITNSGAGLTYEPGQDYCNSGAAPDDDFTYTLNGGSTGTVHATVTCVDDAPHAVDDARTVAEDSGANAVDVLGNDTDLDGGPITITDVTQPDNGAVAITNSGAGLTYEPGQDYCNSGAASDDTFTYTVTGGETATVSVAVTCVDDDPLAVTDSASVRVDATVTAVDVLGNDTDVDGGPISIDSVTTPEHGTVVITGGGSGLTYQPGAAFCDDGTPDAFTYTLTPGGSTATVSVTVECDVAPIAVNDTKTVVEDSGASAVDVLGNDTDSDGGPQSVVSVTQPVHGTAAITGDGSGLSYAPDADYCNSPPGTLLDTFTYTLTPGASSAVVSMTVTCVDDPPVAVNDSPTVLEDSGATTVTVLANDTDVDGGPIAVASTTQPANGTVVDNGADVSYTPNPDYCNDPPGTAPDTFTYTLDGGSTATVSVTVTCVPDAPTIENSAGSTGYAEDAPATVVDGAVTVANPDGADITGGSVSITSGFAAAQDVLDWTDNDLGDTITEGASTNQTVVLTGNGTAAEYEAALRAITYLNSSQDPSTAARSLTFTLSTSAGSPTDTKGLTVTAVDDPPVAVDDAATVLEDAAATAVAVLTDDTDVDAGLTSIGSTTQPANGTVVITGGGTGLTYKPNANYCNDPPGTTPDTFGYTLNGGSTATVSITVTCVNHAPVADDESFSGADSAIGNTSFVGNDPTDGAPDPIGPQKTVSASILGGDTDAEGDTLSVVPGTVATNDGGSVTVQADGDFTFTPAAGTSCSDTSDFFDYTVTDGASPTPGTDTGRVTIAITDCVWYVRNNASAGGDGSSATPFDSLSQADAAATAAGAYLYVYQGDGTTSGLTGGVTLLANQRLVGAAEDLTVAGATLENGADADRPAISGSVTLGAGNTVEGLAITVSGANAIDGGASDASGTLDDLVLTPSGAAGGGISLNGTSGTWNVSDTTITAAAGAQGIFASSAGTVNFTPAGTISVTAAGPAVSVLSTAVSGAIDTTTSTGGSYGWALNAVTGSLDLGTGSVSGHTSTELSVTAGTGDVTYAGTIGNGTGSTAVVQNRTTGAVTLSGNINDSGDTGGGISMSGNSGGSTTFSGSTKTLSTGSSNAVDLSFTGGHIVSFTGGGLDIDTTSGSGITSGSANGFLAVTGSGNTIDVSSGTSGTKGLNVNGPDITAGGLTFQRISTTAAGDGIVLANTGSAGGLTVTGTGTSGTGGVITTSTGAGISLSSARDVSLSGVNVTNGGDDGIRASSVTNLSIAGNTGTGLASSITGNGNAAGENGMDFTELAGVVTITNATVTGSYDNNVVVTNDAATLSSFTIDDGSYGSTNSSGGNDSIQIVNTGSGNLTGTIKNADFLNSRGDHIQLVTDNDPTTTSTQRLTIQNNTLNSTALSSTVLGGGIALGVGGGASQTVLVDNNDIDHAHGAPLSFNTTTGSSPNANWTVNNNRIGNTGEVKSGSVANSGFYINVNGNGNARFNLTNNTIMQTDFTAVDAVQNDGDAAMNVTMKGNVITEPGTTIDYAYGLRFVIGSDVPDNGTSCLDLGDPSTTVLKNRFFGSGNSSQGYQDVRVRMAGSATLNLAGFTGGAHDNAAVNAWMQTRNNLGGTPTTSSSQFDAGSIYGPVASCPLPSVP
jgi:hypothetical protein